MTNSGAVEIGSLEGTGLVDAIGASVAQSLTVGGLDTDTTFSGPVRDGGGHSLGLIKVGTGALTLSGNNTYSGGTTITAGTLQIGAGGTSGSILGNVVNNGSLVFNRSDDFGYSGAISGTGSVTKEGAGVLTFTGDLSPTLSGLTLKAGVFEAINASAPRTNLRFDGGTLRYRSGGVTTGFSYFSPVGITVADAGGTIELNGMDVGSNWNISGPGALHVRAGSNQLSIGGTDVRTGATIVETGTLAARAGNSFSAASAYEVMAGAHLSLAGMWSIGPSDQRIGSLSGAGTVDLLSATLTTGNDNRDTTFSGVIQGNSGRLIKTGTGTFTLTGISTYTGPTAVTGGRLVVNGSIAGSSLTTVGAGATLAGSGTVGGAVTVQSGGTLSAGASPGTLTVGALTLDAGSTSLFELNAPGRVGGGATGNDLVNVIGNLTLGGMLDVRVAAAGYYRLFSYGGALAGAFDAWRSTSLSPGFSVVTMQVQAAIPGQVTLSVVGTGQTLHFWDGGDATGDGKVGGGAGTWSAAGANWTGRSGQAEVNGSWGGSVGVFAGPAGGAVTVAGTQRFDTLQFATNGYVLGGGTLALAPASGAAATLSVDAGVMATIASTITDGSVSSLLKVGGGELVLQGANAYTGGTTVAGGRLSVASDANLGAAGRLTLDGGELRTTAGFAMARDVTLGPASGVFSTDTGTGLTVNGVVAGGGALVKEGAGTLTLTNAGNSYAGGNVVRAGTLAGNAATIRGDILNNGAVVFADSGPSAFGGHISGSGSLTMAGTGTLALTGASTYTGPTAVTGGRLVVNGSIAGSSLTTVGAGATLAGAGTVGATVVAAGGTLSPGNSIGTLTVAGDLTVASGARYAVEVDPAGTASDRVVVSGAATLSGGTVAHVGYAGHYRPSSTYRILTAGTGLTGAFAGATSDFAFLTPSLIYDYGTFTVDLRLVRNDIGFAGLAASRNQFAAAGGVASLAMGHALHDAVVTLPDAPAVIRASFDRVSGEIHASARTALIEDSRFVRQAVSDRLRGAFAGVGAPAMPVMAYAPGGPVAVPATSSGPVLWGQGFGAWGHTDSDGNAAKLDRSGGGFLLGGDVAIAGNVRLGVVGGYSRSSFSAGGRASSGSADSYHLGAYGGGAWGLGAGQVALRAGLAHAWHDIDTGRSVGIGSFTDSPTADYDAGTLQVFGEAGYRFDVGAAALEPFAGLAYVGLSTDGFREAGGAAALIGAGSETDTAFTTLGLRASGAVALGGTTATLSGMLGWWHAFGEVTPVASNAFPGSVPFAVAGAPIARNAAVVEGGLGLVLSDAARLILAYQGQLADTARDHGFRAGLSASF
ncbi:autotransporter domain-containing protein [Chelatococcus sp. SYSU_G07232]|uniref:Autotransporter domain-containing protein n=1 Tax=Chelatococcus albus TaxID=3047466 RepID=A0ABT7AKP2_9HYPH|nr:autotransporter domain-containing protein [Chelatococcus sp. SYSU_G07232]MDJ1159934.1 autotransporter domain-containing protein [Chelatococcus sp. SYSU_G07232]